MSDDCDFCPNLIKIRKSLNVNKNCKYETSHRPKSFWWELRFCDGLADGHDEANRGFF